MLFAIYVLVLFFVPAFAPPPPMTRRLSDPQTQNIWAKTPDEPLSVSHPLLLEGKKLSDPEIKNIWVTSAPAAPPPVFHPLPQVMAKNIWKFDPDELKSKDDTSPGKIAMGSGSSTEIQHSVDSQSRSPITGPHNPPSQAHQFQFADHGSSSRTESHKAVSASGPSDETQHSFPPVDSPSRSPITGPLNPPSQTHQLQLANQGSSSRKPSSIRRNTVVPAKTKPKQAKAPRPHQAAADHASGGHTGPQVQLNQPQPKDRPPASASVGQKLNAPSLPNPQLAMESHKAGPGPHEEESHPKPSAETQVTQHSSHVNVGAHASNLPAIGPQPGVHQPQNAGQIHDPGPENTASSQNLPTRTARQELREMQKRNKEQGKKQRKADLALARQLESGSETPSIPGNRQNHPSAAVSPGQEIAQVPSHDQHQTPIGHHASGKPGSVASNSLDQLSNIGTRRVDEKGGKSGKVV